MNTPPFVFLHRSVSLFIQEIFAIGTPTGQYEAPLHWGEWLKSMA